MKSDESAGEIDMEALKDAIEAQGVDVATVFVFEQPDTIEYSTNAFFPKVNRSATKRDWEKVVAAVESLGVQKFVVTTIVERVMGAMQVDQLNAMTSEEEGEEE